MVHVTWCFATVYVANMRRRGPRSIVRARLACRCTSQPACITARAPEDRMCLPQGAREKAFSWFFSPRPRLVLASTASLASRPSTERKRARQCDAGRRHGRRLMTSLPFSPLRLLLSAWLPLRCARVVAVASFTSVYVHVTVSPLHILSSSAFVLAGEVTRRWATVIHLLS